MLSSPLGYLILMHALGSFCMSFTYVSNSIVSAESEEEIEWLSVPDNASCGMEGPLAVYCGKCDICRRSEAFNVAVHGAGEKGSGLFATSKIEKGKIVAFYAGELLSHQEAARRAEEALSSGLTDNYLLSVCEHFPAPVGQVWTHVDARYFGSLGRYANHRCGGGNTEPCVTRRLGGLPEVVLVSRRDIEAGEEITFDYGSGTALPTSQVERRRPCLCGSPDCIGVLPFHDLYGCYYCRRKAMRLWNTKDEATDWLDDFDDAEFIQPPPPPVFAIQRNVLLTGGAPHTDTVWQSPLVTLVTILALGLWLQLHCPLWHDDHSTTLRKVTFNVLLPCYVLQSMWGASPIDTTLLPVAAYSLVIHTAMSVVTLLLFIRIADRQIRGWLSMSVQGALLSFLYPRLAADPRFGERAVATCLLWDIGGNVWVCQGLLWATAAYFAPRPGGGSPLPELDTSMHAMGKTDDGEDHHHREGPVRLRKQQSGISWWPIIMSVLIQPILPAFVIGLFCNLYSVASPEPMTAVLHTLGSAFKPCLYLLIGVYSAMIRPSDIHAMRMVTAAVCVRLMLMGVLASLLWMWLPMRSLPRATLVLAVLSPASTMVMYLCAQFGYPERFVSMSALLSIVSVFISFMIQHLIMELY